MSQFRSQLVAGVYMYAGDPPDLPLDQKGLPQPLVFEVLSDCETEMLRDLDLSTQNRRVGRTEIVLNATAQVTITATDFGSLSYVALQTDATSDVWWPVEIVNHSALIQAGIDGRLAVALRNRTTLETSWTPEASHTLRLWYDRNGNDNPTLATTTELGNLYDSYLKLCTAAQCRELMNLPVGTVLAMRLEKSANQWKRYANMSRAQGTVHKPPVYTPPRMRRSRYVLDPTRFYLPR